MATPVIIAAAPAVVPAIGVAMVASAKAGLVLFPFIAVVAIGTVIAVKVAEMVDYGVDRGVDKLMGRRKGADENQNLAYKKFLEDKANRAPATEHVKVGVNIPAPAHA